MYCQEIFGKTYHSIHYRMNFLAYGFLKKRNRLFISVFHLVNISWLWWKAKLIVVTCVWDLWRRSQHFFLCGIGLGCHAFTFTYAASYCETPHILVKWMSVSTQNYKIICLQAYHSVKFSS